MAHVSTSKERTVAGARVREAAREVMSLGGWRSQISGALESSEGLGLVSRLLPSCPAGLGQTVLIHRRKWEKCRGEAYGRGRVAWTWRFLLFCKPLSIWKAACACLARVS